MRGFGRSGAARLAVVLVIGVAACSNGKASPPGATVPPGDKSTTTSSVTTVAEPASYEVPEVIDQAYVQRVVSAFDKVLGDAIRVLKREGAVTEEFLKHLLAIYTEQEFDVQQRAWIEEAAQGRAEKTADVPQPPASTVIRLESTDSGCVILRADRDYGPTLKEGVDQVRTSNDQYLVLVRKRPGRDPLSLNPTPWVMSFDGSKDDNSVPRNSCGD